MHCINKPYNNLAALQRLANGRCDHITIISDGIGEYIMRGQCIGFCICNMLTSFLIEFRRNRVELGDTPSDSHFSQLHRQSSIVATGINHLINDFSIVRSSS